MIPASEAHFRAGVDDSGRRKHRVLVLDDDPHLLQRLQALLQRNGFEVVCAQMGKVACEMAAAGSIDVALIDHRLRGNVNGLSVAAILKREHHIPFVLMSGYLHTDLVVQAMRLGAFDVIDKPVADDRLMAALSSAVSADPGAAAGYVARFVNDIWDEDSLSSRWAEIVLNAAAAMRDPRTVEAVASAGRVSTPAFRSVCHLCGVKPSNARWLCRFLRAIARSLQDHSSVLSHLRFGDRRTAERSFEAAGLSLEARAVSLRQFLMHQRFVETSLECFRELAHRAANSRLFMAEDWDE